MKNPFLASLQGIQGLPELQGIPRGIKRSVRQMYNPTLPLDQQKYPITAAGNLRNTNPYQRRYRKVTRETKEYEDWKNTLDAGIRTDLEGLGDYYMRTYRELQEKGGEPNKMGMTPADYFLYRVKQAKAERNAKWDSIYATLDANTRNAFNRFAPEFQEAYMDALIAGRENVVMKVNNQDVTMKGFQAAREIYRQAEAYREQQRAGRQKKEQATLAKTPYRVLVGGY